MSIFNLIQKILVSIQFVAIIATASFGLVSPVYAQTQAKPIDVCSELGGKNCLSGTEQYSSGESKTIISTLTTNLVNLLIFIGAAIAVLFIVFGGYKYITASGDENKIKEGQSMVVNAAIGLVVLIISFTVVTLVGNVVTTLNLGG